MKPALHIADVALLAIIRSHPRIRKTDLWQPRGGAWNDVLKGLAEQGRCGTVSADRRFQAGIATLRGLGFLEPRKKYQVSEAGEILLDKLGNRQLEWPLVIPIQDSKLNLDQAQYWPE